MALCVSGWLAWANTSVETRVIAKSNHNFVFAPDTLTPIWPNEDSPAPGEGGNGIEIPLPNNIHYSVVCPGG